MMQRLLSLRACRDLTVLLVVAPLSAASYAQERESTVPPPAAGAPETPTPRDSAEPAPRDDAEPTALAPRAILTRLTDPVAYLDGEAKAEKVLFHWEKKHELRAGDGFRQGVAGVSEIFFPADHCEIRCHGETHAFLVESATPEHRLRVYSARRMRVEARSVPVVLELPGGVTLTLADTILALALDERDHRWWVKNEGRGEIRLEGPRLPLGAASVPAGSQLELPVVLDPETATLDSPAAGERDVWNGHTVETSGDVTVTRRSDELEFTGSGSARVGGSRIVIDGTHVRVWKPRG